METAPAPAPPILDRCRFGQNPRTAATQYYIGTLHGGHAQRTWVDLNVKNPKAPVVTREVEDGLGAGQTVNHRRGDNYCPAWRLSYLPAILRVTIYATLIMILTMRAASAQNDLPDKQGGQNSWRTKQEKKNGQSQ
ncbi:MAG: hypothetical protein WAL37_00035 [Xanthobacteraceae bacterium]